MPASAATTTSRGAAEITRKEKRYPSKPPSRNLTNSGNAALSRAQCRPPPFAPHRAARLEQMLAPDAAKVRVVADEISQLTALLNEIAARQTRDLLLEAPDAQELTQHVPGI